MSLGEYIGAGSGTTKLLLHLNGSSTDSSGNGNNGTDTNISYVDGKFGKCASFNGSSSYINKSSGFASLPSFTACAWIKTTASSNQYLFTSNNSNDTANLDLDVNLGKFRALIYNGSTTTFVTSNASVNNNTWKFVTATKEGTTLKVYVNGVYDNQITNAHNITVGGNSYTLGRHPSGVAYFNGLIDEVILENRAWTAQEVAKYYTYAKGRYATL